MRILYVTSGFPYPLTSGHLRHYHFIKRLSQHHEIVLVSSVGPAFKREHIEGVAPFTEQVIPIQHIFSGKSNLANSVMTRVRMSLDINPAILEMREAVKKLLQEKHFDLMIMSGAYTIGAMDGLTTPPIIADLCDAKSDRVRKQIASTSSLLWKLMLQVKLLEMQRVERRIVKKSKCVLFAADRDRRIMPPTDFDRSFVIANGVDTEYWQRSSDTLGRRTLIFTGAMHFPPNSDTAQYLIDQVLPRLRQELPDVELLIVGHSPGKKLVEAAARQPGVTITGFVDDMRPFLEKATVFVAPMRFGAGIQNKLLEAMAMSLPIVTSSVAGDGVSVNGSEPPFVVANDLDTFVRCTIDLLQKYDADPTPAYCARQYVERHFTWDRNVELLNEIIRTVQ